tara:strand:+ start:3662 stop:10888 length:7227 start_codon:yes stop_codon:yes gene_type:complete
MLTQKQLDELQSLVDSLQIQGKTNQEIQSIVDDKKAEMLGQNSLDEAKKIEPVTEIAASAAGENDMALQQESGSSDLQQYTEKDLKEVESQFKDWEKTESELQREITPEYIKQNFQGEEAWLPAYRAWQKNGKNINQTASFLPEQTKLVIDDKRSEDVPFLEKLSSWWNNNLPTMREGMELKLDKLKTEGVQEFKDQSKKYEAPKFFIGGRASVYGQSGAQALSSFFKAEVENKAKELYPETFKADPEKAIQIVKQLEEQAYEKNLFELNKDIVENEEALAEMAVSPGIISSFNSGTGGKTNYEDLFFGIIDGTANVATSAIPGMVAGAAGTVLSGGNPVVGGAAAASVMFAQIAPDFYYNYNLEKAKLLYPELDESEALTKLSKENKQEFGIPLGLSTLATGLEYLGFKGMTKAISKKIYQKGNRELAKSLMSTKLSKTGTGAAVAETGTEVAQLPVELLNEGIGKNLKGEKLTEYVWENFKDQAPEVIAQSLIGSRIFIGGTRGLRKAAKTLRDLAPTYTQGTVSNNIADLGVLVQTYEQAADKFKPSIKKSIDAELSNIKAEIRKGQDIGVKLTEEQISSINNIKSEIDNSIKKVKDIKLEQNLLVENDSTAETLQSALEGELGFIKQSNEKLNNVLIEVSKQPDIRNKDGKLKTKKQYSTLQKIYDNAVDPETGTWKNNASKERAIKEIGDASQPIIEAITKRIYDRALPEAKRDYPRDKFQTDVRQEIMTIAATEYDASKGGLDSYISNLENFRANRLANKMLKQTFDSTIEDAKLDQQTILPEVQAFEEAQEKIETHKKLGLKFDTNKIKNILLRNADPDTKKFKTNIADDFKLAFKPAIDLFFGKDTKTKKPFSQTVRENAENLYDALTVEGMRKSRNTFKNFGMLVEENGKLEKAAFSNVGIESLINYLTDPSVAKNTRSNRQLRFKEAVAVSIASAQAVNLLETDNDLRSTYKDINQLKQEVKSNIVGKNIFQQSELAEGDAITGGKGYYNTILKKYSVGNNDLGKTLVINKNNQGNRQELKTWFKEMAKFFPREFFELSAGSFNKSSQRFAFDNVNDYNEFLNSTEFAKNDFKGDWKNFKRFKYENLNKTPEKINGAIKRYKADWKNISKQQETNMNALEYVAKKFEAMVASDINNAKYIATFLQTATNSQDHILRMAAPLKAYSNNLSKGMMREEHTMPSSLVGNYLLDAILSGSVNSVFPGIRKNYFQVALNKNDDNKLKPVGLNERMPKGWTLIDNAWARYFNKDVNQVNGGIDPNSIIFFENSKTVAEIFNVGFDGVVTPDIKKIQQEGVTEQADKVEFVIDRAIAKLTELTGTKGFAVDPFLLLAAKDVSLNVLIGGLRTLKATYKAGKSLTKAIDAGYQDVKKYMSEAQWLEFARVATQEIEDVNTPARARLAVYNEAGVAAAQENIRKEGEKLLQELGVNTKDLSTNEINKRLGVLSKARAAAMNKKAPEKKARVFDFDDTLAKSKSDVLYLLPDGTTGSLTATEFAEQSGELAELGAQFDFSEFSTVKDGSKGPLAVLAKKLTEAKGDRDIFVLTARPAAAAESIQSFLRSALGISIPLDNITGLGDGTPGAKAYWMAEKVSEGYNDLFFADDAPKNVAAVNKMLTDLGVKKKVQVAKEAKTKSLEDEFDTILRSKKPTKGSIFKRFNIYVPPGADDFEGLLYTFLSKGKVGEKQMKFFQDNIMTPFAQGISAYETSKVTLARDYKALKKRYKNKKVLKEKVLDGLYNKEQAVRAYLFNGAGYDLDISKGDVVDLLSIIQSDPKLKAFADDLANITKLKEGYPPVTPDWLGGSIQTDLANVSNKSQRSDFLTEFIKNKNQIFSDQNMSLILQRHGNDFTDALENVLERMETGVNRKKGKDKEFNQALNWLNASVANIMAFNTRSAILQQLSAVNFMNWTFNNPLMMAKAMANVPKFAKDFGTLFNSDFLIERRGGLKIEINTADLANTEPGNWFTKTHKKLLQAGFLPTQYGDSFAIAFGGASWYRNNINKLVKEGVSEADAVKQTMIEFQEIAEKSQQSSRPDKVSRQQASDIGRLILAFANTPLQYARLTKKAVLDLANRRGDWKTNASKIVYYGVAQNLIFTTLQSALFSMFLDDEDEVTEDDEKKLTYALNSIVDGTLRGMGYAGATIAALKNLGMELYDQNQKREKGERVYNGALTLVQKGLSISPPLSKKIGDIVEAERYQDWRQYKYSPFYQNYAKANYVSGIFNVPVDRVFKKLENINAMSTEYNDAWQNVLLGLGWSPYSVDVDLVDLRKKRGEQMGGKSSSNSKKTGTKKTGTKKTGTKNSPLDKKEALEPGVLGKAHKDGTIQVKKGLSPAKKKEVIAHEKKHIADMKSGKLNYDNQNVYWNGKAYPRLQGKKIVYNGVAYLEGHKKLPWEKSANGIKV